VKEIKKKKKKKKKKVIKEKRQGRWRGFAPQKVLQRMERAKSQRLFLIKREGTSFVVLGSVGNVYDVEIGQIPTCTCPDFGNGHLCKHIFFIYLRVLRVPEDSPHIYQKALLSTEVAEILDNAPADPRDKIFASKNVLQKYKESQGEDEAVEVEKKDKRLPWEGEDCPICYEEMDAKQEKLVWCEEGCGRNIHAQCFEQWRATKKRQNETVTCVLCRTEWKVSMGKKNNNFVGKEGYVNLASYQPGIKSRRPTYDGGYSYNRYSRWHW